MRGKRIVLYMLLSMSLGWLNQYFKIFSINYNVKYMIDACVIFFAIMFTLSLFDYCFIEYWYPKNEWKVVKQRAEKK